METLKFKTTQFQDPDNEILLEMVGDRMHIVYGKLFDHIEVERLLSPKETRRELVRLHDLHLENWQDHYESDDQVVKNTWSVTVDDHVYSGDGSFPKNWDYFLTTMHDLVPEAGLSDPDEILYLEIVLDEQSLNKLTIQAREAHIIYTCKENGRIVTMFEIREAHLAKRMLETISLHNLHVLLGALHHQNHRYVALELASRETLVYDYNVDQMNDLMKDLLQLVRRYYTSLPLFKIEKS